MDPFTPTRLPLEADDEWVAIGQDGWTLWHHPDASSVAHTRFAPTPDGTWQITEVRFVPRTDTQPVRANDLRLLALGRLAAVAADPDVEIMLTNTDPDGLPRLDPDQVSPAQAITACRAMPERPRVSPLAFPIPPKGQRDTYFYKMLEAVYGRAATQSRHPAVDIAKANNVPVTTVHAWLKALKKVKAQQDANNERWRQATTPQRRHPTAATTSDTGENDPPEPGASQ